MVSAVLAAEALALAVVAMAMAVVAVGEPAVAVAEAVVMAAAPARTSSLHSRRTCTDSDASHSVLAGKSPRKRRDGTCPPACLDCSKRRSKACHRQATIGRSNCCRGWTMSSRSRALGGD